MGGVIFETIFSFCEMLISCFFAGGIFRKRIKGSRAILTLLLFSVFGTGFLLLRKYAAEWIPDFVPAVLVFALYAIVECRAKWWAAVSWALVNYLFIGILLVTANYVLSICLNAPVEPDEAFGSVWFFACVIARIGQFLLSEIILCVWKRFPAAADAHRGSWKVMFLSSVSIITVWSLWKRGAALSDEALYTGSLVCLLVLAVNLLFLLFDGILAREKRVEEELKTQRQMTALQMRNQEEINNMYQNVLSIKHDMNNHLHTISGYLQVGEHEKAREYLEKIAGEISSIRSFHSGNAVIDALIGSKTTLAELSGIPVEAELEALPELILPDEDLTVLIGNLYDNAIDACLKITGADQRFIRVKILFDSGNLLLLFENAAAEQSRSGHKGLWPTTKEDSSAHGFGIKNIDRIVRKHGGYCERELREHVFRTRIRIPGKETAAFHV